VDIKKEQKGLVCVIMCEHETVIINKIEFEGEIIEYPQKPKRNIIGHGYCEKCSKDIIANPKDGWTIKRKPSGMYIAERKIWYVS